MGFVVTQQAALNAYVEVLAESEQLAKLCAWAQRRLTIPPPEVIVTTVQNLATKNAQAYTIHFAVQFAVNLVLRLAPASSTLPPIARLAAYLVRLAVRQVATMAARVALGRILRQIPMQQVTKLAIHASRRMSTRIPHLIVSR